MRIDFIRYDTEFLDDLFEAKRAKANHAAIAGGITRVVLGPDAAQLGRWLGCELSEVCVDPDVTGLASVVVEIDGTDVVVPLK